MKRAAGAVALGLLLTGCGGEVQPAASESPTASTSAEPETISVFVKFTLTDARAAVNGCTGTGGYDDISSSTQVRLTDQDGSILGIGQLGEGFPYYVGNSAACQWDVALGDVPADAEFYSVEVADRGEIVKSADEVTGSILQFDVSLG